MNLLAVMAAGMILFVGYFYYQIGLTVGQDQGWKDGLLQGYREGWYDAKAGFDPSMPLTGSLPPFVKED